MVVRARIICGAVAGVSNEENARRHGVHPDTVRKHRARAEAAGSAAEAFADAPRSGRPGRIALETRAALVKIACSRPTPELDKARVTARKREARAAERKAAKAKKLARKEQQQAAGRERAAMRNKALESARQARKARKAAVRDERRRPLWPPLRRMPRVPPKASLPVSPRSGLTRRFSRSWSDRRGRR